MWRWLSNRHEVVILLLAMAAGAAVGAVIGLFSDGGPGVGAILGGLAGAVVFMVGYLALLAAGVVILVVAAGRAIIRWVSGRRRT